MKNEKPTKAQPKKESGEILHEVITVCPDLWQELSDEEKLIWAADERRVVLENDRKWLRRIELVTMEYCTCGGSGPGESDCSACAIWHEFREEWEQKCLE